MKVLEIQISSILVSNLGNTCNCYIRGSLIIGISSPPFSLNSVLAEPMRQELLHLSLGRGWVWENVWDQKVLSRSELDSWSWGAEQQLGGWAGLKPWQAETGSEASVVAAARPLKKQNRSREEEQPRRKTASEKTASQMENKFREQEATDPNGKPPEWKRKWNQERKETFNLKLKQSRLFLFIYLFFTFQGVSVDLRWICHLNWVKALIFVFWAAWQ